MGTRERSSSGALAVLGFAERLKRHRVWLAVGVLLAVAGTIGTVFAARSVAAGDAAGSRRAFANSSGEVASTLQLAIQRERDVVVSAAGFFLGDPNASNAQFRAWSTSVQALQRFPELLGWGDLVIVPKSKLAAFAAKAEADPVDPLGPSEKLQVIPAGARAYYCLVPTGQARSLKVAAPPGFDFCAGPTGALTFASRDSGRSIYTVLDVGDGNTLAVQVPFYRGGAMPATVAARRAAFVGWMGMSFNPNVLLGVALQHHADTAVAFRFHDGSAHAVFRAGVAPHGAQSVTIDLHNGWTVQTFGLVASGGVLANGNALALLIAGLALSLVLGVLVFVLGTGRARARRLVDEQTRELRTKTRELAEEVLLSATARDDAVDASNAKSVFVATISHELRTPLSGVIGTADLLLETQLDDEQREYAEIVRSSSEGLLLVINDILDYSKIEAGKLELDPTSFALSELIAESCALLLPIARQKGIEFNVEADPGLPGWLYGDAGRIRQVVINLLSNAVKFTAAGQVTLHVSATARTDTSLVRVEVNDTGIGIDEQTLARLFQPFTQADNSTARTYGGTGLGLTISAQLIELMGGTIGAHSTPGKGSTFWFQVPLTHADQNDQPTSASPTFIALGERDAAGNLTDTAPLVLVAEDNPVNQMLAARQLDKCGYRSEVVSNGREAIEAAQRTSYAAVLMDCQMPEVDGYEATREIRRRESQPTHLPIVATTAHSMSGDREKCIAAGMDEYVSKPIRTSELADAIKRAIATSHALYDHVSEAS